MSRGPPGLLRLVSRQSHSQVDKHGCVFGCSRAVHRRQYASATSSASSKPKNRTWLRITIVTATAAVVGAYVRYKQDSSTTLNPITFTQYELVAKTPVSSTSCIFSMRPVKPGNNAEIYQEAWQKGIWSVQFKQPQLQIGRDYTPLPPLTVNSAESVEASKELQAENETLNFLIRKELFGEVSGYLHDLKLGSTVDIRGPQLEYELPPDIQEVLFIAGGTGIAPALQAAHTLLERRETSQCAKMHILWANRRREDCQGGLSDNPYHEDELGKPWWKTLFGCAREMDKPVAVYVSRQSLTVKHLEDLKAQHPGQLTVDYFVDDENSLIRKKTILDSMNLIQQETGNKLILVSGPEGFVNFLAGPKVWRNGKEQQGPLQGLLGQLDLKGWRVWKL